MRCRAFAWPLVAALSLGVTAVLTARAAGDDAEHSSSPAHGAGHIVVQSDQMQWGAAPPGLPAGAQVAVIDGDPFASGPYVLRVKSPAGYVVPPHWHSQDEHITVLSGKFSVGEGDKVDKSAASTLGPGGYAVMPAKMHHYAYMDADSVIQIHGMGPFDIHYVHPKDDPRGTTGASAGTPAGGK
jgi:quercetin dioxygenase-like cupin family protein